MASSENDSSTSSSVVIVDKEAFQCNICYNDFGDAPYVLHCGHSFCLRCIQMIKNVAIQRHETVFKCPMCSSTQDVNSELIKNYAFYSISYHIKSTNDFILQSPEYKTLEKRVDNLKSENQNLIVKASTMVIASFERFINAQKEEISQMEDEINSLKNRLISKKKKLKIFKMP